ncbi:MAG: pyridoxamine 5'-phosphate oxidase family protein [Treponema sp.]|nr:pyridoxamine 5'-phosphate oxidase family protein [Treponema sp.]
MFRKMRRNKQQLSDQECVELLKQEPRGVLALLGDDGYPYTVPMDFFYDEGKLYFHCAKEGHKIDAIKKCGKASFCVMDKGFRRQDEWALNIKSVVAFGRIRLVEDRKETMARVRQLGNKYNPSPEAVEKELERTADIVQCLEFQIEHMTGKLVNES